eukprot:712592-Pleurochrysis_carterae.AAC.1
MPCASHASHATSDLARPRAPAVRLHALLAHLRVPARISTRVCAHPIQTLQRIVLAVVARSHTHARGRTGGRTGCGAHARAALRLAHA